MAQKYHKFPLFGKESPRTGEPLDRFLKFLGAFIRPTILHQRFKFNVIRFTGYGVIAEKPRVGQLSRIFRAPCRKNYAFDRKMNFDGLGELYHHGEFEEDRTTRRALNDPKGPKTWCLYVFFTGKMPQAANSRY